MFLEQYFPCIIVKGFFFIYKNIWEVFLMKKAITKVSAAILAATMAMSLTACGCSWGKPQQDKTQEDRPGDPDHGGKPSDRPDEGSSHNDSASEDASTTDSSSDSSESSSEASSDSSSDASSEANSGSSASDGASTADSSDAANTGDSVVDSDDETDSTDTDDLSSLSSIEFSRLLGNGIDLGNTLEATGSSGVATTADEVTAYEVSWGQPETTKEMIQGMKDAGFDSIRIPVAWTNGIDVASGMENGDFTISEALFERVEEVVDYALDSDMYVVLNDHWDGGWWAMFGNSDTEIQDSAYELYSQMWTQITDRFKDKGDHLIFESGNEELGDRFNDKASSTRYSDYVLEDGGVLTTDECYELTNKLNQTFVDIVRSSGSNNTDRFLLLAGYGTNIDQTVDSRYVIPTDTATDKLLVSVHYYDPSGYCIFGSVNKWGSTSDFSYMESQMAKLSTTFTSNGIGVIVGEWGVLMDDNELRDGTETYMKAFLDTCVINDVAPIMWDCNNEYDKETCSMRYDNIAEIFSSRDVDSESGKTVDELVEEATTEFEALRAEAYEEAGATDGVATAWLMYTSSDWSIQYSVGDEYKPDSSSSGIESTAVDITGDGEYTVGLDFTENGGTTGTAFMALGIANGEELYPNSVVQVTDIKVDGESIDIADNCYTTTDDGACTRVNLYNEWVVGYGKTLGSSAPSSARVLTGSVSNATSCLFDNSTLGTFNTIEITFTFYTEDSAAEYRAAHPDESSDDETDETNEDVSGNSSDSSEDASDETTDTSTATAFLMYTSSDWGTQYCVGEYNPSSATEGIVATDTEITGAGEYSVSIDLTQTANGSADGTAFMALGITNGESLFPGAIVEIKDILVNGESIEFADNYYTTSDDGVMTRVNLYNEWIVSYGSTLGSSAPSNGRCSGTLSDCTSCLFDKESLGTIETLEVQFEVVTE